MLFLGLGVVCGACLMAGAALTRCTRKRTARLPSYRLAQTGKVAKAYRISANRVRTMCAVIYNIACVLVWGGFGCRHKIAI